MVLRFVGLTSDTRTKYNLPKNIKGVVITAVKRDSFAAKAGLTVGSVISQISQVNVKSADDAKKIFEDALKKDIDSVLLQVFQNDFSRFLILKSNKTLFPLAIFIGGPTASGKSKLAIDIQSKVSSFIVNADSMQVYDKLDILTNKPNKKELKNSDCKLFSFLKYPEKCNVGLWRKNLSNC